MNNRKWSRIIAMLLAVMLVFCDSNVIYAVESMTEAQTEDPAAAQAAADAEAARQAAEAEGTPRGYSCNARSPQVLLLCCLGEKRSHGSFPEGVEIPPCCWGW